MASVNVEGLNLKQLLELQDKLPKAVAAARNRERAEVIQRLSILAEKKGFTLSDLVGGRRRRKSLVATYVNPDDSSESWTGRGRRPKWLVAKILKGAKLEHFAV